MKIEFKTEIVNADSKEPIDLLSCPCGNKTFYVSRSGVTFCASCRLTQDDAQIVLDESKL